MSQEKKLPRIKLSKSTSEKLNRFSLSNIKNKFLRHTLFIGFTALFVVVALISVQRLYTENTAVEINEVVLEYFNDMNHKDFDALKNVLYPSDNETYISNIAMKAQVVGLQSIRLQKIYPPLVMNNIAIVGFETSTNNLYKGEDLTFRETNQFFMLRKDGKWYVAKPEDLLTYDQTFLSEMIEKYSPIMQENMKEGFEERLLYNSASFEKLQKKNEK